MSFLSKMEIAVLVAGWYRPYNRKNVFGLNDNSCLSYNVSEILQIKWKKESKFLNRILIIVIVYIIAAKFEFTNENVKINKSIL